MLDVGDRAPDFALPDAGGREVRLSELLERGPVVLYFYPADFTPGCTRQACLFRDASGDLAAAGVQLVGVSPQDEDSHRRFKDRHDLGFPLLADTDKSVIAAYGATFPFGLGVRRVSYLIGQDGAILDREVADLAIGKHGEFAERVLQRLG